MFNLYRVSHPLIIVVALSGALLADESAKSSSAIATDSAVAEILKEVEARHGGQPAVDRWASGTIRYTTHGGVFPMAIGQTQITEAFKYPGHVRRLASIHSPDGQKKSELLFVINANGGWMVARGKDPLPMDPAGANRRLHPFADICNVPQLLRSSKDASNEGIVDIDGIRAILIRIPKNDSPTLDVFVDVQSGLIIKTLSGIVDPKSGRRATVETRLKDYTEKINGGPVPMSFSVSIDGSLSVAVDIHSVKFTDEHPPGTFQFQIPW